MNLTTEIRIDWDDLDVCGHVNNLSILRYVQTSRIRVCEAAGLMKGSKPLPQGPILAAINCRYLKPLYYPGVVRVMSGVTEIKNTSFLIRHLVYDAEDTVAAEVTDVIVYFDYTKDAKMPIPDMFRTSLSEYTAD